MTYSQQLAAAVSFANSLIAQGVSFYSATEQANEEFNVSLPDIQKQATPTNLYEVSANGTVFGRFDALNEQIARDLCAKDAGYKSELDMASQLEQPSELIATLVA